MAGGSGQAGAGPGVLQNSLGSMDFSLRAMEDTRGFKQRRNRSECLFVHDPFKWSAVWRRHFHRTGWKQTARSEATATIQVTQ